jgi:hypothetical protein
MSCVHARWVSLVCCCCHLWVSFARMSIDCLNWYRLLKANCICIHWTPADPSLTREGQAGKRLLQRTGWKQAPLMSSGRCTQFTLLPPYCEIGIACYLHPFRHWLNYSWATNDFFQFFHFDKWTTYFVSFPETSSTSNSDSVWTCGEVLFKTGVKFIFLVFLRSSYMQPCG